MKNWLRDNLGFNVIQFYYLQLLHIQFCAIVQRNSLGSTLSTNIYNTGLGFIKERQKRNPESAQETMREIQENTPFFRNEERNQERFV